jgi:multidrug efflux pump subunit AcrB
VLPEKLLLYKVNQNHLYGQLKTALDQYEIGRLRAEQTMVPIVLGEEEKLIEDIISTLLVRNSEGTHIPATALVSMHEGNRIQHHNRRQGGRVYTRYIQQPGNRPGMLAASVEQIVRQDASLM